MSAASPSIEHEAAQPHSTANTGETSVETPAYVNTKKPLQFWLVFLGTCVSLFLAALELTSVGTALPAIVHDLTGADFIWVGSAYAIAAAAFMPTSGGLANIVGRRAVMLASIAIFALGSALAGAAQSMTMLIIARTIQGTGGGGIMTLAEIIVADMVPLRERGNFGGLLGVVWALASVLGPPVGGGLASAGQWRWLFFINLPLCAIAAALVFLFLKLKTPEGTLSDKIRQVDWTGNAIVIASTTSVILALAWGGVQYPWDSYRVLVPLIVGFAGIISFLFYEAFAARHPIVPRRLWNNRTTVSGYASTLFTGMVVTMITYYLPTYFQGAKADSAIHSGVLILCTAIMAAPAAIVTGQTVERTGHYLIQNYIGWALVMIGYGTMSLLTSTSSMAKTQGLQIIGSIGIGILQVGPMFSILAPLAVQDNAHALALSVYIRTFGQTFGITVGTTILQNGLKSKLLKEFLASFPQGAEISYAVIPLIKTLGQPLRAQVEAAFGKSISNIWIAAVIVGGAGFLVSIPMKQITLHTMLDDAWGFENNEGGTTNWKRGSEALMEAGEKPHPSSSDPGVKE